MSVGYTTGQADQVAIKDESSTPGTPVVPAGTDYLRIIADASLQQFKNVAESLERVNSFSVTNLLALRYNKGTARLEYYMKRTGTVDTAVPSLDTLLTNAYGIKTTNGGTNITYSLMTPSTTKKNFSLFYKKGNIGLQATGGFVQEQEFNIQATPDESEVFRGASNIEFYRMRWAGYTVTTEDASTTDAGLTMVKVATADLTPYDHATAAVAVAGKFCIGAYIMVGALTTSHKITAINATTGVITFTPALGSNQTSGAVVKAYMPSETDAGSPIAAHKGLVTFGGANYASILQAGYRLTNSREVLVDEKNDSDWPTTDAWVGKRHVVIDPVRAHFDANGTPQQDLMWALADQLTQKAVVINVGNVSGYKWQINAAQGIVVEPNLVGEGIVDINFKINAVASSSLNDESTLVSF